MRKQKSPQATISIQWRHPVCFVCQQPVTNVFIQSGDQSGVTVMHPACSKPIQRKIKIQIVEKLLRDITNDL
jgi:hypothetical protein